MLSSSSRKIEARDNLFHDPVLINRGADIASIGQSTNGPVTLTPVPLVTNYGLSHGPWRLVNAWTGRPGDHGRARGFFAGNCPANPQYQYVQASDVQSYFTMAETYTFGDRMFQTNQGPSFPAHQYILSGDRRRCACQEDPRPSGTTRYVLRGGHSQANYQRTNGTTGAGCLAPPGASGRSD